MTAWLIIFGALGVIALLLPGILRSLGLHPRYDGKTFNLQGKKALIVTTSHAVLNKPGQTKGAKTGVFGSEMTVPYYEFIDAGMEVDLASIQGGQIPIEPQSFWYMLRTQADKRYLNDSEFQNKVKDSRRIDDIDFTQYDVILIAGGWGAAYDLGTSDVLGEKISEAYKSSEAILGGVCHGVLGFIRARDQQGDLLIKGRKMTGVTNKQIKELMVTFTPQHPEEELIRAGANFTSQTRWLDILANLTVVDEEQRFVTGQNQNAGHETAQKMMALVEASQ